jgi:hypothetical protein
VALVTYIPTATKKQTLIAYAKESLFVVHCAGPHRNATDKAAIKLAQPGGQ